METKATFTRIRKTILTEIEQSKNSIKICVAWFTSKELIGALTEKLKKDCKIEIIISDDIINKKLPTNDFIQNGGSLSVLAIETGKFLHEKFAIFDNSKVLTGSYNWTNFAEYRNHESVIISFDSILVKQYKTRFEKLKQLVERYTLDRLKNTINSAADLNESQFDLLEANLEEEFRYTIKEANQIGASINTHYILNFLETFGAIGGAKKLISEGTEKLHSGLLKLWEIKRLDLSFEHVILKEKYKGLFDDDILFKAQERLNKLK